MIINKHRGFVSPDLNETLGIKKVELRSSGRNNPGTSSIIMEGSVITTSTNRGITIVTMNEDWTVNSINRFDVISGENARNQFADFIRNRPANKWFFIITYDSIDTNPNMSSAMISFGSIRFTEIPFDPAYNSIDGREYNKRIPYCAIAGSEVGIVYESLGSGKQNVSVPDATITAMLPELKYFGCQGFGRNLIPKSFFQGNTYTYLLARPMDEPAQQYYKFSYFHKIRNQDNNLSKGAWVRFDRVNEFNNQILETVYNKYIISNQWKREEAYFPPLENGERYRGSIVVDGVMTDIIVDRMTLQKAGVHHPYYEDNHFGRVTDTGYTSALHLRNGMFGVEPYYADAVRGAFEMGRQLFDDSLNIAVYEEDNNSVKGIFVDGDHTSNAIEINDTDIGVFANCLLYSTSFYRPKITTTFYDENMVELESQEHIIHNTEVEPGNVAFLEWFAFKPVEVPDYPNFSRFQNIRFGSIRAPYGYSTTPEINAVLAIPEDAKFITYTVSKDGSGNYYMAFPCANTVVPMAGRQGYISPANFNVSIPELPPVAALLFEKSLYVDFYQEDVGAPTPENIIAEWPRASNTTYWDDPNAATGQSADWFYNASQNSFSNPNNSSSYIQLLSPDKSGNFEFESIITSPASDNDTIGLVAAANDVGGDFETLLVACNAGHLGPAKGLSLYLMSTISGNSVLASSIPFVSNSQGWSGRSLRVKIIREGNKITAMASAWNDTDLREDLAIEVDLAAETTLLAQPSRYGFFSYSQANAQFLQYQVTGAGVYDRRTIYDGETLEAWFFNDSNTWVKNGRLITDDIIPPRVIENPVTKKKFNVNYSGATLLEENGIVGTIPILSIPENTTATYQSTTLTELYDYDGNPLTINKVSMAENCTVSLSGSDVLVTVTDVSGYFYLYLEAEDGTIGFKRYDVTIQS